MSAKSTIVKKVFSKSNLLTGAVIPGFFAVNEYNYARNQGNGVLMSTARAAGDFVLSEALGWGYMGLLAASALPSLAVTGYQAVDQMTRNNFSRSQNLPFANSRFRDSQPAYTMRQQGMQLAKASKYNLEQTLMGNEASHFS